MNSILMENHGPMWSAVAHVQALLSDAIARTFGVECNPQVTFTNNSEFGDLQSNVALLLSKTMNPKPKDLAAQIVEQICADDVCEKPTIAGPGFINFKLQTQFVPLAIAKLHADERLGVWSATVPARIVIDMSSPNIAKEMHVGHLRSTIIGESLSRLLSLLGHDVLKINHVGDWGTQFGMLIAQLKENHPEALVNPEALELGDIVAFYKKAKKHFDEDEQFQTAARQEVVKLQSGDVDSLHAWKLLCDQSRVAFQKIYDQLGIENLIEQGESFYNPQLEGVVKELQDLGLAVESKGALCVFLPGFVNHRDGKPLPLIVQKQDGGYNYASTDLAAMRHRVDVDKATDLIYVVDAGQSGHLQMVTKTARLSGWVPGDVRVEHVSFGLVLGEDGKKLKTRSGETVKLQDLLDVAVTHALEELVERLDEKGQEETPEWLESTAQAIGIGAVKYNDLSLDRSTNYKFELKKMLSLNGNTAPFLMYAYTRVNGIIWEGGIKMDQLPKGTSIVVAEPLELELAKQLLKFNDALKLTVDKLMPNKLCEYLFELSQRFNRFYHDHQVLNAPEPERTSRLILCDLTARTLKQGLSVLGIPLVERM